MTFNLYSIIVNDTHPYLYYTIYGYTFNTAYFGLVAIETSLFKGKSV